MKRMQEEESSHEKSATLKKWNINATQQERKKVKVEENMKSKRNSDALKEVQHETSKVQHWKSPTWIKCYIK